MKRIHLYEYDRRNREKIVDVADRDGGLIYSWSNFSETGGRLAVRPGTPYILVDVSSLFANEDRLLNTLPYLDKIISFIIGLEKYEARLITERRFSSSAKDLLYFRIDEVVSLEEALHLEDSRITDIVDLDSEEFKALCGKIDANLFGNRDLKEMFFDQLGRFRVFNRLGTQHIFSAFLYGHSGIGKTELGRLLTRFLAPGERIIKINFGNYSGSNALNSLIGSPRGYVGSSKGELSEKLLNSRSSVIIIDEFEKASREVHNFFLQLLEDGSFTDSLGRDYDLDKYIILFTSNLKENEIDTRLTPEFRSRLNMLCHVNDLSRAEKQAYLEFRTRDLLSRAAELPEGSDIDRITARTVRDVNVNDTNDLRVINREIMKSLGSVLRY